jgi:serine carboxypeptidase-like clade 2
MIEFGPWRPVSNGSVVSNPFSFTKIASIVFLEQPAGVGFSYSTKKTDVFNCNDYQSAKDNLLIIKKFFERFPERKNNKFFISSESYGNYNIYTEYFI